MSLANTSSIGWPPRATTTPLSRGSTPERCTRRPSRNSARRSVGSTRELLGLVAALKSSWPSTTANGPKWPRASNFSMALTIASKIGVAFCARRSGRTDMIDSSEADGLFGRSVSVLGLSDAECADSRSVQRRDAVDSGVPQGDDVRRRRVRRPHRRTSELAWCEQQAAQITATRNIVDLRLDSRPTDQRRVIRGGYPVENDGIFQPAEHFARSSNHALRRVEIGIGDLRTTEVDVAGEGHQLQCPARSHF